MTWTYAGEYAGDVIYRTQGAAGSVPVTVDVAGGGAATLYTDATKDTPLGSNVVDTDSLGNLAFFADPGTYTCTVGSASFTAVVPVNPLEPGGGGGSGTVTSVTVESANGLAGTVADSTTTPQVTLSTTVTGLLKGAGGAIEAATAGTDYLTPSGSGAALTGITAAQVGADASGAAGAAQSAAETYAAAQASAAQSAAEAASLPIAGGTLTGGVAFPVRQASSNTAASASDYLIEGNASGGAFTVFLPTNIGPLPAGQVIVVKKTDSSGNAVSFGPDTGTIDGYGSAAIPLAHQWDWVAVVWDGSVWTQVAGNVVIADLTVAGALAANGSGLTGITVSQVSGAAPLASPALTGSPTAPTKSALTDNTDIATTAYTDAAVAVETSRAETAEALKAPLASPALTGSPTAPTQTSSDNSTKIATDAFVQTVAAAAQSAAEAASDPAGSAATAQSNAETYAAGLQPTSGSPLALSKGGTGVSAGSDAALLSDLGAAPLASPALTGTPTAPTASALTDSTQLATTAYTDSAVAVETSRAETAEALKAPLASPALTGTPTAPTASGGDNSTKLATTAFVQAALPGAATTSAAGIIQIDGTAADITASGTQAAGSKGQAADSEHVHPATLWIPADQGFLIAAFAPEMASTTYTMSAGVMLLVRCQVRSSLTLTNVWYAVEGQATGSSTGSYVGVYNSSGTLLSGSADIGTNLKTTGAYGTALSTPQSLSAGTFVWLAILENMSGTQPTVVKSGTYGIAVNANLTAATGRCGTYGATQTSLPSPLTLANIGITANSMIWMAGN